jgi:hypothetical protein
MIQPFRLELRRIISVIKPLNYDGVFIFRVPDWTPESTSPREFPLVSIQQLKTLLQQEHRSYNVNGLINKIDEGMKSLRSASSRLKLLKSQFDIFTDGQKKLVSLYLAWMFNYSMWMRFWKGPGQPWPLSKVNVSSKSARNREQRSSPEERDEYIFIQNSVRTHIIEEYEKDTKLKDWIDSLPVVYYDFDTKETSLATRNIKEILDQIAIGDYCMGFGSDTILKTAYCYIIGILGNSEGTEFDAFLTRMLPALTDIEYTTISNQLPNITTDTSKRNILRNRMRDLQGRIAIQQPFSTIDYQNNIHI